MKNKFPYLPRTVGLYGCTAPAFTHNSTWVESEMLCSDHGKFERRGLVRHSKTNQLIRVRADVPDTYFSMPATTKTEHGFVTCVDLDEYGIELHFIPHTDQWQSPAQFRKETRKAYR